MPHIAQEIKSHRLAGNLKHAETLLALNLKRPYNDSELISEAICLSLINNNWNLATSLVSRLNQRPENRPNLDVAAMRYLSEHDPNNSIYSQWLNDYSTPSHQTTKNQSSPLKTELTYTILKVGNLAEDHLQIPIQIKCQRCCLTRALVIDRTNATLIRDKCPNCFGHAFLSFTEIVDWLSSHSSHQHPGPLDHSKNRQKIFNQRYAQKQWGCSDGTYSGPGSTKAHTENTVNYISTLLDRFNIDSIVDVCGDFHWQWGFLQNYDGDYLGVDISQVCLDLIDRSGLPDRVNFKQLDIIQGPLPTADLWVVRDVLFHLCLEDVGVFFRKLKASNSKYLLVTTYQNKRTDNPNIPTGGYHPLNLEVQPFELKFLEKFVENPTIEEIRDKSVGLISIRQLP